MNIFKIIYKKLGIPFPAVLFIAFLIYSVVFDINSIYEPAFRIPAGIFMAFMLILMSRR